MRGMQYRTDFIIGLLVSMSLSSIGPVIMYLIFAATEGYRNWNIDQMMLFQGLMITWFGLKDTLFGDVMNNIETAVRNGTFDVLMLRPVSAIGSVISFGFYYQGVGGVIAGIIVSAFAISRVKVHLSAEGLSLIAICIAAGLVLYLALVIIYCGFVLRLVSMNRLNEIFNKMLMFATYPSDIYARLPRTVMTLVIPIALWAYFPANVLLGRVDLEAMVASCASVLIFILSLGFWNYSVKRYTSAGG